VEYNARIVDLNLYAASERHSFNDIRPGSRSIESCPIERLKYRRHIEDRHGIDIIDYVKVQLYVFTRFVIIRPTLNK